MKRFYISITALCMLALVFMPGLASAQDTSTAVKDGGIFVKGWTGQIDANETKNGQKLDGSRLSEKDGVLHVTTGPSVSYWQSDEKADGSYMVMATFTEPKFKNLSGHPHPYGLFIGGNDMGTEKQSLLYCMAYGNGKFLVRGFSPEPFKMNGDRQEDHEAVNKASADGASVSQDIAISVTSDKVSCSINGTVVASYAKSEVVGAGKLKSTNGAYGIRFGHNVEGTVKGFHMMK
jgi:hypothetical protein